MPLAILFVFLVYAFGPLPTAQADELVLPQPGMRIGLSSTYQPSLLVGMQINPQNPFQLNFIFDPGQKFLSGPLKRKQYQQMVEYFLASLTIPNRDMWVNLSPYEKNRIIPDNFGQTMMGSDLLSEDYLLKMMTSSLIYPEEGIGKKFWYEVYRQAREEFGTTNIPVNTFNKVWIVPDKAEVYEKGDMVVIISSHLKVMLEEDYEALKQNRPRLKSLGSQVVRQIVLPVLEKEVNEGKNFATLRQIYSAMLMATWFKKTLRQSILGQAYADRSKLEGINLDGTPARERIYREYLKAFKKGAFNFIKEDVDPLTHETIPRKYFSGGMMPFDEAMIRAASPKDIVDFAQGASASRWDAAEVLLQQQVFPKQADRKRFAGRKKARVIDSTDDFDENDPDLGWVPLTDHIIVRFVNRKPNQPFAYYLKYKEIRQKNRDPIFIYRLPKDIAVQEIPQLIENMQKLPLTQQEKEEENIILPQTAQRFQQLATILERDHLARDHRLQEMINGLREIGNVLRQGVENIPVDEMAEQDILEWFGAKYFENTDDIESMKTRSIELARQAYQIKLESFLFWQGEGLFKHDLETKTENMRWSFNKIDLRALKSRISQFPKGSVEAADEQIRIIQEILAMIRALPGWNYRQKFQGIREESPSLERLTKETNCMAKCALTALYLKELGIEVSGVEVYLQIGSSEIFPDDLDAEKLRNLLKENNTVNDLIRKKWGPKVDLNFVTAKDFVKALNEVLAMRHFYRKIDVNEYLPFLDKGVQVILARVQRQDDSLEDDDYARLNRSLLEAIYPQQIKKAPEFSPTEHVLLLARLADRRHFLVEPSGAVRRSHVISLPLARDNVTLNLTEEQDPVFRTIHIDQWQPMITAMFYTALGMTLKDKEDFQGAIESHRKAIALYPNYSSAYTNLGVALLAARDETGAVLAHQKAIQLNPSNSEAWSNLGVAFYYTGDMTGAIDAYKHAIHLDADNVIARNNLNNLTKKLDAIDRYRKMEANDDQDVLAWGNLAVSLWNSEEPELALKAYEKIKVINPKEDTVWAQLGDIFYADGKYKEAQEAYETAIQIEPGVVLYNNLGNVFYKLKLYKKAEASYRQSLAIDPDRVGTLRNLGNTLFWMHDIAGGREYYSRAIALAQEVTNTYASLLHSMMLMPSAQEAFDIISSMQITSSAFYKNWGDALIEKVDSNEEHSWDRVLCKQLAIKAYSRAIEIHPTFNAYNNLGNVYYGLKHYSDAEASYRKSLEMDTDNTVTLTNLANTLFQMNRIAEGLEFYRQAIALDSEKWSTYSNLLYGVMLMPTAQEAFDTVSRMHIASSAFYNNFGFALAKRASNQDDHTWDPDLSKRLAIEAYTKAVELDPDNGLAERNLRMLKKEDSAQIAAISNKGGIDFNDDLLDMHIRRNETGMPLVFSLQDPAMFNIGGLAPLIVKIVSFDLALIL